MCDLPGNIAGRDRTTIRFVQVSFVSILSILNGCKKTNCRATVCTELICNLNDTWKLYAGSFEQCQTANGIKYWRHPFVVSCHLSSAISVMNNAVLRIVL